MTKLQRELYVDYAAATPLAEEVLKTMLPYLKEQYANPSSFHDKGREARKAIEKARATVASVLGAKPSEITFTGGGTESINLALKGIANISNEKKHIITSSIEHESVLEVCSFLRKSGVDVTFVPVNKEGMVEVETIKRALRPETILVSVMYANNETGAIQPIAEIGKLLDNHKAVFHTDACQAGLLDLQVNKLNVDLMTLNAAKLYGPKGVGILYRRSNLHLQPLVHGGGQEFGLRSGTENVAGIVGCAAALERMQKNRQKEWQRLQSLRSLFTKGINEINSARINSNNSSSLPHVISLTIKGVDADALLIALNERHVYAAAGSACVSKKNEISHVLKAMGLSEKDAGSTIRLSWGEHTTEQDIHFLISQIKEAVKELKGK